MQPRPRCFPIRRGPFRLLAGCLCLRRSKAKHGCDVCRIEATAGILFALAQRRRKTLGHTAGSPTGEMLVPDANQESSLLPMLVAGLVLVAVGGIAIMMFV
ncbi:hypothetical protein GCM10010837_20560 [Aminobacter niigataensis]